MPRSRSAASRQRLELLHEELALRDLRRQPRARMPAVGVETLCGVRPEDGGEASLGLQAQADAVCLRGVEKRAAQREGRRLDLVKG